MSKIYAWCKENPLRTQVFILWSSILLSFCWTRSAQLLKLPSTPGHLEVLLVFVLLCFVTGKAAAGAPAAEGAQGWGHCDGKRSSQVVAELALQTS
jgi:hypothetical protein